MHLYVNSTAARMKDRARKKERILTSAVGVEWATRSVWGRRRIPCSESRGSDVDAAAAAAVGAVACSAVAGAAAEQGPRTV